MRRFLLTITASVLVPCFALFAFAQDLHAQVEAAASGGSSILLSPFGGRVLGAYPCTCTAGSVTYLVIGPPSAGTYAYTAGTPGYKNYNLPYGAVGAYVLGLYSSTIQGCYMYAGYFCYLLPTRGMISPITGTSLVGGTSK